MLSEKQIKGLREYWVKNSKEKLKTMKSLYKDKRYADCLFYGHMVLEMVLKAHAVKKTKKQVVKTHNLHYLNELSALELKGAELELILDANSFNMETRYPNEKLEFYKLCTKKYTDLYYDRILSLHKKLCQKIK